MYFVLGTLYLVLCTLYFALGAWTFDSSVRGDLGFPISKNKALSTKLKVQSSKHKDLILGVNQELVVRVRCLINRT